MGGLLKPRNVTQVSKLRTLSSYCHSRPLRGNCFGQHSNYNGTSSACMSATALRSSNSTVHSSLESFLSHARSTALSPSSTVYVGTIYEYQCQSALARLGLQLERVGGAGDAGVDLRGTWTLPSLPQDISSLPVIVQCKALAQKPGPALVRELEGAISGAARTEGDRTVGVLCATKSATKGVRDTLRNSARPMVWLQVEQIPGQPEQVGQPIQPAKSKAEDDNGSDLSKVGAAIASLAENIDEGNGTAQTKIVRIRQMLWNEVFERIGARGMSVGLARVTNMADMTTENGVSKKAGRQSKKAEAEENEDSEIVLLNEGEIWTP